MQIWPRHASRANGKSQHTLLGQRRRDPDERVGPRFAQKAVEKFRLDWADFEDRHELMLHAFEMRPGNARRISAADRLLPGTAVHARRLQAVHVRAVAGVSRAARFSGKAGQDPPLHDGSAEQRVARDQRIPHSEISVSAIISRRFSARVIWARANPIVEIYSLSLKITQRDPAECVLIDDRGLNLECAQEMGMQTIQFENVAQLRGELGRLGVNADE